MAGTENDIQIDILMPRYNSLLIQNIHSTVFEWTAEACRAQNLSIVSERARTMEMGLLDWLFGGGGRMSIPEL